MTDKNKADQSASHKKTHIHDTSSTAQRSRLLERLRLQPVDTITARRDLNIMMPAARVKELRDKGHDIRRHLITLSISAALGRRCAVPLGRRYENWACAPQ